MKLLSIFAMIGILPGIVAFCQEDCDKAATITNRHESPFACDRLALTPAQRKRHFDDLTPQVHEMVKSVRELPNGYEFEFAPDSSTLAKIAEWIASEHLLCPCFAFDIRVVRDHVT